MKWLVAALAVLVAAGVIVVVLAVASVDSDTAAKAGGGGAAADIASESTVAQRDVVVSSEPQSPRPDPSGDHVDPSGIGTTIGAVDPDRVIVGDIEMVTDHEILEDVTILGCVSIGADFVTLRNVEIDCATTYPVKDNASTGTRLEHMTIDCLDEADKGVFFEDASDFGVDRIEVRNCDDSFFIDGGLGDSWITNSVFHQQAPAEEAHTDGAQIGTFEPTTGNLVIGGNWWDYDRQGCCDNAVVFVSGEGALTVDVRYNRLDGDFGTHLIRCHGDSTCVVEHNRIDGAPAGLLVDQSSPRTGTAGCNRFADGELVPSSLYSGVTVNNQAC